MFIYREHSIGGLNESPLSYIWDQSQGHYIGHLNLLSLIIYLQGYPEE